MAGWKPAKYRVARYTCPIMLPSAACPVATHLSANHSLFLPLSFFCCGLTVSSAVIFNAGGKTACTSTTSSAFHRRNTAASLWEGRVGTGYGFVTTAPHIYLILYSLVLVTIRYMPSYNSYHPPSHLHAGGLLPHTCLPLQFPPPSRSYLITTRF